VSDPDAQPLARYVFRGFYYYHVATSAGINYSPCALRAKLLRTSRLGSEPLGDLANRLSTEAMRLKDVARDQELIELLASAGMRLSFNVNLAPTSVSELKVPLMFSYLLREWQQSPERSFPEVILSLRRSDEILAYRDSIHSVLAALRSDALTPNDRDSINKTLKEMSQKLQQSKYAKGIETAEISLLPLLDLGVTATKPFASAVKALSAPVKHLVTLRLPRWLFEEYAPKQRMVIMWKLFEERAALRNVRELFNREWNVRNYA
jgi:hypothetical protein